MNWTLDEFLQFLKSDKSARVLFVEGDHDLTFWHAVVPAAERTNTTVYKVGTVQVDGGGERDKIMILARIMAEYELSDRVLFFADADNDRLLSRPDQEGVVLTDARDREAYLANADGVACLCETTFNKNSEFTTETLRLLKALVRPLGVVRVTSERHDHRLPFQRTFHPVSEPGRVKRYWVRDKKDFVLHSDNLLGALLSNAGKNLGEIARLKEDIKSETHNLSASNDDEVIHGKDFVAFVAWRFGCSFTIAQAFVNICLCSLKDKILQRPSISAVAMWVRDERAAA